MIERWKEGMDLTQLLDRKEEGIDPVQLLPDEVIETLFGFLDVADFCRIACCNKVWRHHTNLDIHWLHFCQRNRWEKYGKDVNLTELKPFSSCVPSTSKTSPTFVFTDDPSGSLEPVCKWKGIYMRAHHLTMNWRHGKYFVAPPLRGHQDRVTCLDCNGTRQRTISCHDNAGVYYDVKRCGESDVASMEDCEVECTQDCVLGRYGSWSDCNEQCGMDGHKFRERVILMESRGLGRNCPKNSHSLVQNTSMVTPKNDGREAIVDSTFCSLLEHCQE
ncbi:probable E3 ubiquitin ligase complex SCF subunit sconB [Anneissia japonica]|uniref:probable E3 ubiquitin ligase complex SCF subunit sconB n=1 Tax=Anneissia japonica TaxID=1529436 RepID=UPI001425573F|nr:probable E3 ubiquitin ligase complex SCF subunit sconB [Anneissia japonica]